MNISCNKLTSKCINSNIFKAKTTDLEFRILRQQNSQSSIGNKQTLPPKTPRKPTDLHQNISLQQDPSIQPNYFATKRNRNIRSVHWPPKLTSADMNPDEGATPRSLSKPPPPTPQDNKPQQRTERWSVGRRGRDRKAQSSWKKKERQNQTLERAKREKWRRLGLGVQR